jgi:septum formation protein
MTLVPTLFLASTSPARKALMDSLGMAYTAESPGVDEVVPPGLPVEKVVEELSLRKAKAVLARHPEARVLGADQMAELRGLALGKPQNREAAKKQLSLLMGQSHRIVTGVCLLGPQSYQATHVESTALTLYRLTPAELDAYLDTGEWEGCAGGYRVEGRGQALVASIDGDRTNVQGLPMLAVVRMLREAGLSPLTA